MITPKETFQSNPDNIKAWADYVDDQLFTLAATTAISEYGLSLSGKSDAGERMQGAKDFLALFMGLSTPTQKPPQVTSKYLKPIHASSQ
jgi:hypothetical protein